MTHNELVEAYHDYIIQYHTEPKKLVINKIGLREAVDSVPTTRPIIGKIITYMGARIIRSDDLEPNEFFWA